MSITEIPDNNKMFHALSTDFPGGVAPDAMYVGSVVYLTDMEKSYFVDEDLNLIEKEEDISGPITVVDSATESKALMFLTGTISGVGDNTLWYYAGSRVAVDFFVVQNESTIPITIVVKEGSTAKARSLAQYQGDGLAVTFPIDARWEPTADMIVNLSVASGVCGYTFGYHYL
jgi:hypothetical protein